MRYMYMYDSSILWQLSTLDRKEKGGWSGGEGVGNLLGIGGRESSLYVN